MKRLLLVFTYLWIGLLGSNILFAQPVANFTLSSKSGCSPLILTCVDASTGGPTSLVWTSTSGGSGSGATYSTTLFIPGTYIITLTASNAAGTSSKSDTVTVYSKPNVNFTASDTLPTCAPKTVTFTDISTLNSPGTPSYFWDFGDGFTSTATQPTHTYTTPGTYPVTLNVSLGGTCNNLLTKTNYIQVVNTPVPNFSSNVNSSCTPPLSVTFSNNSLFGTSYYWDFGNGQTSTATNPPAVTYSATGSYTVTLVATTGFCSDTLSIQKYISIGALTASFTQSTPATCTGNPISFTNTSLPGPGTSTWYFGDGTSGIGANTSHTYSTPGTYTVTLVVNYNNCTDTATNTVTILQGPNTQFTASSTSGCVAPFTTTFTNTSTGATSFIWDFGDGSPMVSTSSTASQTHTYQSFGTYNATLIATSANGCSDTFVVPISVVQATLSITPSVWSVCQGNVINFSTTPTPSTLQITNYTWNFGDGSSPVGGGATNSHSYTNQGSFNVTVTFTTAQGCTYTSAPITVTILGKPIAAFTVNPDTACPKQKIFFTNTSIGGSTYTWYYGNGGSNSSASYPTHDYSYLAQGIYTVTLYASVGGCSDSITHTVYINYPVADFVETYNCINKNVVSFVDSSKSSPVPNNPNQFAQLDYYIDYGDVVPPAYTFLGTSVPHITIPTHTYPALTPGNFFSGTYMMRLMVIDHITACTSLVEKPIILYDIQPSFTANDTTACVNQSVQFSSTFVPGQSHVMYVEWDFGDGTPLAQGGIVTNHTYTTPGVYTVKLISTDFHGCKDTFIRPNYISVGGPIAKFGATSTIGCSPLSVNFIDSSTARTYGIASFTWHFGNGATSITNQKNLTYIYNTSGTYDVTLVVVDSAGCTDSVKKTGFIQAVRPIASFSTIDTFICPNNVATFTNTSVGNALTYDWDFGDGTPHATTVNATHAYPVAGTYTIRLIATDNLTCKDTFYKTIIVSGLTLTYTVSDTMSLCPPLIVTFINTSVGVGSIFWDLGNGSTSINDTAQTIYTLPGTYTVKLKGANGQGCQDSVTRTIVVGGAGGTLTSSPHNGCAPLTITLTSNAVGAQIYIWDLDNGFTDTTTVNTYTYTYPDTGRFVPRVILSDGNCIVPIQSIDTIVSERLIGDFSFSPTVLCKHGNIHFYDTVIRSFSPVSGWLWDFGDGSTGTIHNPVHFYTTPGTYTVKLIMTTAFGCKDTITKTVTILQDPTVAVPAAAICVGQTTAGLQASGATSYVWSPATGLSCTNCSNPIASPTATTTYTVIGTAANGCLDTTTVTVTVNPLPNVSAGPPQSVCGGTPVVLNPSGAISYVWSPSTGLSCTNCTSPSASPSAKTIYTVTGTDANGCTDTGQVVISSGPNPAVIASPTIAVCAGSSVQLASAGANTYTWSPASGLSCTNCPSPLATPTATTTYVVTGIDSIGCTDTGMATITVNPNPVVSAGANQSICLGFSTSLQATGAASFVWSPAGGLSCTTCSNPTVNITNTTTYSVVGTNSFGCTASSNVTVTVNNPPVVTVNNPPPICVGSAASLQVGGATTYVWSPATGLSCTNCSNPSASPATTTTYTVIGTDMNGCSDTATVTVVVNPLPPVNAGPDKAICIGKSTLLQANGAVNYTWSPSTGLSCTNCPNPTASPTSTITYTLTGTDANGCVNTDSITVTVNPLPTIDAGMDKTICEGESIGLLATGAISYAWTPLNYLSCYLCATPIASPKDTITFVVEGTDQNGCKNVDSITINVIQKRPIFIGPGDTVCKGEAVQLMASGGDSYYWTPTKYLNDPTIANPIATPEETMWYKVVITQGTCFNDSGFVTVGVRPQPTVDAGEDQTILSGASIMLYAKVTNANKFLWTDATSLSCHTCQNPIASPLQTTTYTVTVTNQFGCKASDDVVVNLLCEKTVIFVANTFTPNGDGVNDRLYPQGNGILTVKSFRIYNRWGQLLFEARNIKANNESLGWDGRYKGELLTPDVYVYVVDAVCLNGQDVQQKGDVSIIR